MIYNKEIRYTIKKYDDSPLLMSNMILSSIINKFVIFFVRYQIHEVYV